MTTQTLTQQSTTREVGTFLVATYAMALGLAIAFPEKEIGALLTILVPVTAVAVTIRLTARRGERRSVWRTVGLRRAGLWSLVLAVTVPVLVTVGSFGIAQLVGVVDFPTPGESTLGETANVLTFVAVFSIVLLGEEIGWRGYLFPRLAELLPVRRAAVVTGACHAAFHLPLLLLTTTYQGDGSRWVVVPVVMVTLTLSGTWYGWLRARTGSIWPATLSHSTFNAVMEAAGAAAVAGSASTMAYVTTETGLATLALMVVLAVVLVRLPDRQWRPMQAESAR